MQFKPLLAVAMSALSGACTTPRPTRALVYRGPASSEGCPEAIAKLLQSSNHRFEVTYAGPDEDVDISAETLADYDIYAFGGGEDLGDAWKDMKEHADTIRDFVSNGGRYLGFCLGAYLAGSSPGFGLLPKGADTDSEAGTYGAQVNTTKDTLIQVDWRFTNGKTQHGRWLYFQEGPVIAGLKKEENVLARYSSNGDVAASPTPYGRGWVGLCGPHPEATQQWYDDYDLENPDGIRADIGHDFIEATMKGGN